MSNWQPINAQAMNGETRLLCFQDGSVDSGWFSAMQKRWFSIRRLSPTDDRAAWRDTADLPVEWQPMPSPAVRAMDNDALWRAIRRAGGTSS